MEKRLKVVNLFAGPGAGKSTIAALTFALLKAEGILVELLNEYAKELTWEERKSTLQFQPYVMVNQLWRQARLIGKVDIIVTDSPIIIGLAYGGLGVTPSFPDYIIESFDMFDNLNFFITRNSDEHPYVPVGRTQTEAEAVEKDRRIRQILDENYLDYEEIQMTRSVTAANYIFDQVLAALEREKSLC